MRRALVGFGSCRCKYENGREGESCVVGFAIRQSDLVIYLLMDSREQQKLAANSVAEVNRCYG